MFHILCPTDFSENSMHAYLYALNLANQFAVGIHVVSSFKIPSMSGRMGSFSDKIIETLSADLDDFVAEGLAKSGFNVKVERQIIEGNTTVSIINYSKKHDINLVIVGTRGASASSKMIFGSITQKLFETSPIPVLAIPKDRIYSLQKDTLLLALDVNGIKNIASINLLKKFKNLINAKVQVFHVDIKDEEVKLDPNSGMLADITSDIIVVEGIEPVYEIKKYADEHPNIGVIALVRRKHTLIDRILQAKSTVESLAINTHPILVLPD